jgi:hypothetical protein
VSDELVSKFDIEKLGVHFTLQEDGSFKVDVIAKLVGENHAYQTTMKVDRSVLEGEGLFDRVFEIGKEHLKAILKGEVELGAV